MPRTSMRVGGLLAGEALMASPFGGPMRLDHHPGRERRAPEIPDLPGVHQVAQSRQGIVDIGAGAGPVDLVEVDVVRAQPAQAGLALGDYPAPRIALPVAVFAHLAVELSWPARCPGAGRDRVEPGNRPLFLLTHRPSKRRRYR